VQIRHAEPGDTPAIEELCAASLPLDPDAGALPGLLLGAPDASARVRLVAESAGTITGTAFGSLRHPAADGPVLGHLDLLAVAPPARGHGTGAALLGAAEQELAARGARGFRVAGNPPLYAWPGVDSRYAAMVALAARSGYERYAEALNMAVDLTAGLPGADQLNTAADEARLAAGGGITVRRAAAAETKPLGDWLTQGPWGGSSWPAEVIRSLSLDPPGCHVAERAGQYLGFASHGVNRRAWFGPMGTLDAERRRGIGAVLLKRCLADIRDSGLNSAQIGWTGPVQFYARAVGALPDRVFWLYRKGE
jgi:predicted N-acetyltransferase YhbS